MADKKPDDLIVPPQGMFQGLIMRSKLILRLMGDKRVSPWLKLIPVGTLVYVLSPLDFIPGGLFNGIGAVDDAAILGLGTYLFLEMCPPDVVQEHLKALGSNMSGEDTQGDVVDAEAKDLPDDKK